MPFAFILPVPLSRNVPILYRSLSFLHLKGTKIQSLLCTYTSLMALFSCRLNVMYIKTIQELCSFFGVWGPQKDVDEYYLIPNRNVL